MGEAWDNFDSKLSKPLRFEPDSGESGLRQHLATLLESGGTILIVRRRLQPLVRCLSWRERLHATLRTVQRRVYMALQSLTSRYLPIKRTADMLENRPSKR